MRQTIQSLLLVAALALAGCAAPAKQLLTDSQPVPASQPVDLQAGSAGPLKLGMTADEAIAALGTPETKYTDFLAWDGGKLKATLRDGKVVTLVVQDHAYAIAGFHVGDSLDAAQHAFPQGKLEAQEVPIFELPGDSPHAWLEVMPSVDHEILSLVLSSDAPDQDEEH